MSYDSRAVTYKCRVFYKIGYSVPTILLRKETTMWNKTIILSNSLCQKTEIRIFVDAEVQAGGDVSQPHRVVPVDVAAGPLDPGHLQTPEGPGLLHYTATFVDDNA